MYNIEQGQLLDRISVGKCPYPDCGNGALYPRRLWYLLASLTLPVALRHKPVRMVGLDLKVCRLHAGKPVNDGVENLLPTSAEGQKRKRAR